MQMHPCPPTIIGNINLVYATSILDSIDSEIRQSPYANVPFDTAASYTEIFVKKLALAEKETSFVFWFYLDITKYHWGIQNHFIT